MRLNTSSIVRCRNSRWACRAILRWRSRKARRRCGSEPQFSGRVNRLNAMMEMRKHGVRSETLENKTMIDARERNGGVNFGVRVQPRARRDEIEGERQGALRVR